MINRMISQVAEFHDAFGVKRGNVDVQLRYDLFKEEFDEYKDAKDLVEKTDAIVDMLYIACGTLDVHGWNEKFMLLPYFKLTAKDDSEILVAISNYMEDYKLEQDEGKLIVMIHALFDLANYNNIYDILPQLFDEIHASNMSKLDENGKPIINDGIIDPRKPIGKVLKGSNYFEPKLKDILDEKTR